MIYYKKLLEIVFLADDAVQEVGTMDQDARFAMESIRALAMAELIRENFPVTVTNQTVVLESDRRTITLNRSETGEFVLTTPQTTDVHIDSDPVEDVSEKEYLEEETSVEEVPVEDVSEEEMDKDSSTEEPGHEITASAAATDAISHPEENPKRPVVQIRKKNHIEEDNAAVPPEEHDRSEAEDDQNLAIEEDLDREILEDGSEVIYDYDATESVIENIDEYDPANEIDMVLREDITWEISDVTITSSDNRITTMTFFVTPLTVNEGEKRILVARLDKNGRIFDPMISDVRQTTIAVPFHDSCYVLIQGEVTEGVFHAAFELSSIALIQGYRLPKIEQSSSGGNMGHPIAFDDRMHVHFIPIRTDNYIHRGDELEEEAGAIYVLFEEDEKPRLGIIQDETDAEPEIQFADGDFIRLTSRWVDIERNGILRKGYEIIAL